MAGNTHVVMIGGGFAGVMAANRLTRRDDVSVTLINPRQSFVARLRLHQLAGGSHDAVADYREVLAEGVRLVVDTVTEIDVARRVVTVASGGTVGYDYLVYAVGSGSMNWRVPGAAESAYPIATLETARRLRSVLDTAPATAAVTVVGGGPTGIETATELAEQGRRGHAGVRWGARPVPAPSGSTHGRQAAGQARRDRARRRDGHGGDARCRATR